MRRNARQTNQTQQYYSRPDESSHKSPVRTNEPSRGFQISAERLVVLSHEPASGVNQHIVCQNNWGKERGENSPPAEKHGYHCVLPECTGDAVPTQMARE